MLTLKNQIIQEKISTFTNIYPFILIFHSNTMEAKQWIDFRKKLYLKNIKTPCKNLPIRFFSKKYPFKDKQSIENIKISTQLTYPQNNSISDKFLNNLESLGGPACFFFCKTKKEIQDILKVMKELNEVKMLPSFVNVGMLIREENLSDITLKSSQIEFFDYKFLSFYDIEKFITLNSTLFISFINILTENKQIYLNINNFIKANTQLLSLNYISLLQLIDFHRNTLKN